MNSNNGKNKQNTIFDLYLETMSVYNSKRQNKGSYSDSEGIIFNTNDYYLIQVSWNFKDITNVEGNAPV